MRLEQPVPTKVLAEKLNLSERTIRNYVSELNGNHPRIHSSRKGLTAAIEDIEDHLEEPAAAENQEDFIPESPQERAFYLIQQLLLKGENPAAVDVCEDLLISDSTLKSDLIRLNRQYKDTGIRFRMRKGKLEYTGEAQSVRNVIRSLIREETRDQFLHLDFLRSVFDSDQIDRMEEIWSNLLEEWKAEDNDLILSNLIYHTMLIVTSSAPVSDGTVKKRGSSLAARLSENLEEEFSIRITDEDYEKLEVLARQCTGQSEISPEAMRFCENVRDRLERDYFVDLSEESFIRLLESHVEQLLKRVRNQEHSDNPLTASIRANSPVVYEMAVSAADEFRNEFGCRLDEGEIAFFALHIGVHLEFAATMPEIYAVCPAYRNLQEQFLKRLQDAFKNNAKVIPASIDQLPDSAQAFVVTAVPLPPNTYPFIYLQVSPFMSEQDIEKVRSSLDQLTRRLQHQQRIDLFDALFSPDLFEKLPSTLKPEEILKNVSQKLIDQGLADEGLTESVLERERICSTAYEGFAIPHPLHPFARKSGVATLLFPKPVDWSGRKVHLAFLISLKDEDGGLFREVYEPLTELLLKPGVPERLAASPDFEAFRSNVIELMI